MNLGQSRIEKYEDGYFDLLDQGKIDGFIYDFPYAQEEIKDFGGRLEIEGAPGGPTTVSRRARMTTGDPSSRRVPYWRSCSDSKLSTSASASNLPDSPGKSTVMFQFCPR